MFSIFLLPLALALTATAHHALADEVLLNASSAAAYNAGQYGKFPTQTFHSSDVVAPRFLVSRWDKKACDGASYIFIAPDLPGLGLAPMILSAHDLSLVYTDPSWAGGSGADMQMFDGNPYLTFWSGNIGRGSGSGGRVLADSSYKEFVNLTTHGLPNLADNHEVQLTHDGGMLLSSFYLAKADCSAVKGPRNCTVRDYAFQEVDIATGNTRFSWRATDHFDISETLMPYTGNASTPFDWFHINSLEKTISGDYLISPRLLSALVLINGTDGGRIWQLGGKKADYHPVPVADNSLSPAFGFPHHARFAGGPKSGSVDNAFDEMIMVDNHHSSLPNQPNPGCTGSDCSRGLRIRLDHNKKSYSLVREFYHPAGVQTSAKGSYQTLDNGNVIVGYGTVPAIVEFKPNGEPVLEVQIAPWSFTNNVQAALYRVFKHDWTLTPSTKPSAVVKDGHVYVSWNGATEVALWRLCGGQDGDSMAVLKTVPRSGFETAIEAIVLPAVLKLEAVDKRGHVIGSTDTFHS
ncbi:Arylsulfotransferase-domain-containing protein [Xylariaceae sp. FL0804]|nr:Arylsulfotransferase-domain-containing protein [Xylariaceae sp. FL0804]